MATKSKIAQAAEEQMEAGFAREELAQKAAPTPSTAGNSDLRAYVGKTISLPVDRLFVKDNVRKTFKKNDDYWALVESIKKDGLAQNLTAEKFHVALINFKIVQ